MSKTASLSRLPYAWLALLGMLSLSSTSTTAADVHDQASAPTDRGAALRSVRVVRDGSTTSVVIEADGPLPRPTSAPLSDPPRIYFDLHDVSRGNPALAEKPGGVVRAIRIAERTTVPLVTRIVLDLVSTVPYHVNASAREQGRLVVTLGSIDAIRPAAQRRAPAADAVTAPRQGAGRSTPAFENYGIRIASALLRLHALRRVLIAIDKRTDTAPGDLETAAAEFDSVAHLLGRIKPPPARESAHALLLRVCTFGARAVRMRQDAVRTQDPGWNAASAAAGALLMLDRANDDLARGDRNK